MLPCPTYPTTYFRRSNVGRYREGSRRRQFSTAEPAVDQSLLAATDDTPHHARHANPDAVDETALDELFALV
jgi:hypothetical protein